MTKKIYITLPEHSKRLKKVKQKNTKPEILVRKQLWARGYDKLNSKSVFD